MKITVSAPINVMEGTSDDFDDAEIVTDPARLQPLDGINDREETFCEYLPTDAFEGIELSDNGISLQFDPVMGCLRYVTEYQSDVSLTEEQIATLRRHTVDLWQEGIGVNFAQLTLTEKHDLIVVGDDQVGKTGTQVNVEE